MGCLSIKISKALLAFMAWNSGHGSTIGMVSDPFQINLPGEPLTPQDFANARIFPKMDTKGAVYEECEVFNNGNGLSQRSQDQPDFKVWEDGYIPYLIDIQFDLFERAEIAKALSKIRATTCIQFVTRIFQKDHVFFRKRSGPCGSFVGRLGDEQIVTVNKNCMTEGSILHELLHVIGMEHEQCRNDRDKYIRVSFYNITEKGKHNFHKISPPRVNYAGTYDLLSITHYSAFAFGKKEGFQTIFPNDKVKGQHMGQREHLSDLDQFKINTYYNCSRKTSPPTSLGRNYAEGTMTNKLMDLHRNCPEFARMGACNIFKASAWMRLNCPNSCNSTLQYSPCLDYNESCVDWAEAGHCTDTLNEHYMTSYCSKSCNICTA